MKTIPVHLTDKAETLELTCPACYWPPMLDAMTREPSIKYNTDTTPARLEMPSRNLPYWAKLCAEYCRVDTLRGILAERGTPITIRDIRAAIEDQEARAIIIDNRAYQPNDYARAALEYLTQLTEQHAGESPKTE